QGNQEREDAQSLGNGEAEDQVRELAGSSRRVAQGARQEVAEDVGHANGGAGHTETSNTGTDVLCGFSFHFLVLSSDFEAGGSGGTARRDWVVSETGGSRR